MTLVLHKIARTVAGEPHLIDIDLRLEPGTINVVLGRTGAGKTSLLRVLAGLDRPSSGTVRRDGVDITRLPPRDRSVALVYQQFINYPSLTVRANIASPLARRGARDTAARVVELARLLRIEDMLDRLPGQLSGGQQQRVAIARALAKGAELVLFDEPLVNLDYKLREDLRDELRALFGAPRAGVAAATVVYATTDPAEALALGGTTIVMHEGRVLQHAATLDVYHRPASVAAAREFSDPPMNLIDGEVRDGVIVLAGDVRIPIASPGGVGGPGRSAGRVVGGHLAGLADGAYRFGIRASDCRLHAPASDGPYRTGAGTGTGTGAGIAAGHRPAAPGAVVVPARVELSEITGSETFVYLRGTREPVQLIVQLDGVFHHQLDDELLCSLDPDRLLAFHREGDQPLVASYHPAAAAPAAASQAG